MSHQNFVEFFSMISATIPDDEYFEMYIMNTFRLLNESPRKNVYAG